MTDDTAATDTLNVKDVEYLVGMAIAANYITILMRNLNMVAGFYVLADLTLSETPLSSSEKAWKIVQVLLIFSAGILPLWRPPHVTKELLSRYNLSPYLFTGGVLFVSLVLITVSSVSYYFLHLPYLLIALSLVNSFVVNELKYAEPYFCSNWIPCSNYTDTSITCRGVAAVVVLVPAFLLCTFKTAWIGLLAVLMVSFVSYFVAFACRDELDKHDEYKNLLHMSEEYLPLEWNDTRSYDFYKVHMRQQKLGTLTFATYWLCQYL